MKRIAVVSVLLAVVAVAGCEDDSKRRWDREQLEKSITSDVRDSLHRKSEEIEGRLSRLEYRIEQAEKKLAGEPVKVTNQPPKQPDPLDGLIRIMPRR